MNSRTTLITVLLASAIIGASRPADGAEKPNVVISWGHTSPDTAYVRRYAESLEQRPFDGVVMTIDPRDADDPTEGDGVNEEQLAAVARSVAAQDPQRDLEAAGLAVSDRNAELLLSAPFDLAGVETPGRHRLASVARERRVSRAALLRILLPPS